MEEILLNKGVAPAKLGLLMLHKDDIIITLVGEEEVMMLHTENISHMEE